MNGTVLSPEQLAQQREQLYNQQQQLTIQATQQSAQAQRNQLQQGLSAARKDYQQARLQAQQGFFDQNRDILTATGMRGLAESGQARAAELQGQVAYGTVVSDLYGQKQAAEQQALQRQQEIEQNLQLSLSEANLQRANQQLQSDTQLTQQLQSIDDNRKAQIVSLIQMAAEGTNPTTIQSIAEAYGISEEELTTVVNASTYYDPVGDLSVRERWNWSDLFKGLNKAAGLTFVGSIPAGFVGAATALAQASGLGRSDVGTPVSISSSDGSLAFEGTRGEVLEQARQAYASQPMSDKIQVTWSSGGTLGGREGIVFVYQGREYTRYNDALAAARGAATQTEE